MNKRELALAWWRTLSPDEKSRLIKQYFPDKHSLLITGSSIRIQQMFEKEVYLS